MAFLHGDVSRRKFDKVVGEITSYATTNNTPWQVIKKGYPFIGVGMLNTLAQQGMIALRVDMSEWPHRPFSIHVMTLDFQNFIPSAQVPKAEAVDGGCHIYDLLGKTWFCTQGTFEFHENYAEDLPWEAVRSNPNMQPAQIISRCVNLIDRSWRT